MKYALFTGATGGLGAQCVEALSQTGRWTIFASGTNEAALERLGGLAHVIPLRMNVTDEASIETAHQMVAEHTGALDAVANFAGISYMTSLVEEGGPQAMERLFAVNVLGMARVNRTFLSMLDNGRGRILNCSSEVGWMTPAPFAGPYAVSKYAVEAYSDSLRRELLYLEIPVVKIQPGSYETPMLRQIDTDFDRLVGDTRYYKELLVKMRPMMTSLGMSQKNDPNRLARIVLRAMEAKRPKRAYRVGTDRLLALMELLPEWGVDAMYRAFFGKRQQ